MSFTNLLDAKYLFIDVCFNNWKFYFVFAKLEINQAIGDKVICEAISYTDCMANVAIYQI